MATKELNSPFAQGPKSLPNPVPNSASPEMPNAPKLPKVGAPAPMPSPQPSGQQDFDPIAAAADMEAFDPIAAIDSDAAPTEATKYSTTDEIIKGLEVHGPRMLGGTLMAVMGAPVAAATGPFAPVTEAGLFGLGAAAGQNIADIIKAAPQFLQRGKEAIDGLVDWAKGDKEKQLQVWDYLKGEVQNVSQGFQKYGGIAAQDATAAMVGMSMSKALSSYANTKFLADLGVDTADLNKALSDQTYLEDLLKSAGVTGVKVLPGIGGKQESVATARAQQLLRQIGKGTYGDNAQKQLAAIIGENNARLEAKIQSVFGKFEGSQGGVAPEKALQAKMDEVGSASKQIFESIADEYGNRTANIPLQDLLDAIDEPIKSYIKPNGELYGMENMSTAQRQWAHERQRFHEMLHDYLMKDSGVTMGEMAKAGEQLSGFQGVNPLGQRIDPLNKTAAYGPDVFFQDVTIKGKKMRLPMLPPEMTNASELGLPTQSQIGFHQTPKLPSDAPALYGGNPVRMPTIKELDGMLDSFQEVTRKYGEGSMKFASKKVKNAFYDAIQGRLPEGDFRGQMLRETNSQFSKIVDDFRDMQDIIDKNPNLATDVLIKPKDSRRTKLVFDNVNERTGNQIRKSFLDNLLNDARKGETGYTDPAKLQNEIHKYDTDQIDMVFGYKGAAKDIDALLNASRLLKATSPEIAATADIAKMGTITRLAAKAATRIAQGYHGLMHPGDMANFIEGMLRQNEGMASLLEKTNFRNQLMRAAMEGAKKEKAAIPSVGQGLLYTTGVAATKAAQTELNK